MHTGAALDNYFQTGDHFWRKICLGLAGLTFALGVFKLIYLTKPMEEEKTEEDADKEKNIPENEDNVPKENEISN